LSVIARPERGPSAGPAARTGLWQRRLEHYPATTARYAQLALVALITTVLFWQVYVVGGVSTLLLSHVGMSFSFFVAALAILFGLAAFGAMTAGLLDRAGRANIVVVGLAVTTILSLCVIPFCTSKWSFTVALAGVVFVEGTVLVATPALVRDFSPQLGRGSAMALWTIGPACGSLLVTKIANLTLPTYHTWQSQYVIAGIASVIVLLAAVAFLRELSPSLRDQLMVELGDVELIEAKAASGRVTHEEGVSAYRHLLRRPRVLAIALGISLFLALYYTFVFLLPVVFGTVFGYSPSRANGLGSWYWASSVVFLIVAGVLSDRVNVRKPFMLAGAIGTVVLTIVLLGTFSKHTASYADLRLLMIVLAAFVAFAYVPWMASFTETVEDVHPSLVAVGLSVWGWIIRIVVMVLLLIVPSVVPSMNTLVEKGPAIQAEAAVLTASKQHLLAQGGALKAKAATLQAKGTALKAEQQKLAAAGLKPTPAQLAAGQAEANQLRAQGAALKQQAAALTAQGAQLKARAAVFLPRARQVQAAAADAHSEWQDWLWICVVCQLLFIPFILLMRGYWSPRAARAEVERHERETARELARLRGTEPGLG
jgi:MFS family permease